MRTVWTGRDFDITGIDRHGYGAVHLSSIFLSTYCLDIIYLEGIKFLDFASVCARFDACFLEENPLREPELALHLLSLLVKVGKKLVDGRSSSLYVNDHNQEPLLRNECDSAHGYFV